MVLLLSDILYRAASEGVNLGVETGKGFGRKTVVVYVVEIRVIFRVSALHKYGGEVNRSVYRIDNFSTTDPILTDVGSKPGLRGRRPVTELGKCVGREGAS
jgi:hypothetical protein